MCVMCYLYYYSVMDIDVKDKDGLTPLHIACEENLPNIVTALMDKGAGQRVLLQIYVQNSRVQ